MTFRREKLILALQTVRFPIKTQNAEIRKEIARILQWRAKDENASGDA